MLTRGAVPFVLHWFASSCSRRSTQFLVVECHVIRLFSEHFQSLRPDSHVGGGEHLPASVQESCFSHIMSALHAWLSGQCNTFSRPIAVVASPFSVVDSRPPAVPVELAPAERPVSPPSPFDVGAPGPFRPEPIQASTTSRAQDSSSHFGSSASKVRVLWSFCVLVRRRDMPRKGWSAYPTPAGWYSVIRGPRPPAEQWPRCQHQWEDWNYGRRPEAKSSPVQRRWQRNIVRSNPDEVQAAARARVARLEEALKVLGEGDSTEVRGLQAALKEARRAAQDRPLAVCRGVPSMHPAFTRGGWQSLKRNRRRSKRSWTPPRGEWPGFGKEWPRQCQQPHRSVRNHTARTDPSSCGRARTSEGTSERDGDRARGGSEETLQIFVGPISRPRRWARFVIARLGRSARRTRGARQRSSHGDVDQPREHIGSEFEPIQSVGLTDVRSSYHRVSIARRVLVWGRKRSSSWGGPEPRPQTGSRTQTKARPDVLG